MNVECPYCKNPSIKKWRMFLAMIPFLYKINCGQCSKMSMIGVKFRDNTLGFVVLLSMVSMFISSVTYIYLLFLFFPLIFISGFLIVYFYAKPIVLIAEGKLSMMINFFVAVLVLCMIIWMLYIA